MYMKSIFILQFLFICFLYMSVDASNLQTKISDIAKLRIALLSGLIDVIAFLYLFM